MHPSAVVFLKLNFLYKENRNFGIKMPRKKSSPLKYVTSGNGQSKTWVLILQDDMLNVGEGRGTPDIVKLRHPRSGGGALFLFSHDDSIVREVFSLSEKRSWFIGDSVRENGKIHFSTPVDPLFLILPYLRKSMEEEKIVPLEDLLMDRVFPDTLRILKCGAIKSIHLLADKKGPEDLNAWMYNEEKAMKWLCRKTEKVAKVLREKQINVAGSATSKNFLKPVMQDSSCFDKESYLKYAHGLVSEYLTDDVSLKLSSSLGLVEEPSDKWKTGKRRSSTIKEQENVKKIKGNETTEILKAEQQKNLLAREKKTIKIATSSRTIEAFFKKK